MLICSVISAHSCFVHHCLKYYVVISMLFFIVYYCVDLYWSATFVLSCFALKHLVVLLHFGFFTPFWCYSILALPIFLLFFHVFTVHHWVDLYCHLRPSYFEIFLVLSHHYGFVCILFFHMCHPFPQHGSGRPSPQLWVQICTSALVSERMVHGFDWLSLHLMVNATALVPVNCFLGHAFKALFSTAPDVTRH